MRRKSNPRVPAIKNDELRLEQNIPQNLKRVAIVALNRALAHPLAPRRRRKVDQRAGDGSHIAIAEAEVEIRKLGIAGEVVGFLRGIENCALNASVVSCHGGVVEEQERSSCVGDGGMGLWIRLDLAVADLEGVGRELPEASRFVHRGELDGAGELGGVNLAEFVGADSVVFEVGGENRLLEGWHDIVEEGWLGLFPAVHGDCVDVGEAESEKPIGVSIFDEAIGDGSSQLYSLRWNYCSSNINLIDAHFAICVRRVAVVNSERGTWYALECGGFGRVIDVGSFPSAQHGAWQFGVENPQVRGSSVKVHAELLPSNGDGRQELGVTLLRLGRRDTPSLRLSGGGLHLRSGSHRCSSDIRDSRLVHLSPPIFPVCLVQSCRAGGDVVYIPALSLDLKGPASYFCCRSYRSCKSRSTQKSDGEQ